VNRRALWFGLGFVGAAVAGYHWWSQEQEEHQRALFSPRPMRRLAALGWLSGRPTAATILLLREYVRWEHNPVLNRRARRLISRFENALA
jgi:hypothetical protein